MQAKLTWMQRTGAHLYFEFATDFVLYYSHDCHSPACLQSRQHPPQNGHRREQTRRCGVAAQRWRFTVRAVSGHGPAMYSTRLHADAAAIAAAAATDDDYFTATAIKLPTTAHAHTMSNSCGCSRSCNVAVHDNHGNGTSPNLFTAYYPKAVHDFMTAE